MTSAYIRRRVNAKSTSYQVCFRAAGRGPVLDAGTFKTIREARLRRDLVAGEIAAGRDPRVKLRALDAPAVPRRDLRQWADLYIASRVDLDDTGRRRRRSHLASILELIGDRNPATLTPADVQEVIATISARVQPASVKKYVGALRLVLDFAKVDPNPARDDTVRLPTIPRVETVPPTAADYLAMLDKLSPARYRLPVVLMEQTAMRVGETMSLQWGDVDTAGSRLRLRSDATKANRARWVQVPGWLMTIVDGLCPLEDRSPERPVFRGNDENVRAAMRRACQAARIAVYTPHDLRHRRASLWHGQGVSGAELAKRGGWSGPLVPLQTYSHVMALDEAPADALAAALQVSRG